MQHLVINKGKLPTIKKQCGQCPKDKSEKARRFLYFMCLVRTVCSLCNVHCDTEHLYSALKEFEETMRTMLENKCTESWPTVRFLTAIFLKWLK